MMTELPTDFDALQALARISETAISGIAGKGKILKPEHKRQVVQELGEILVRSTLPLAHIAEGVQNVSNRLYADALGETWSKMTPDRRADAVQWIEGLPKDDANVIRRFLIPIIAEQDPRSGRLILPAKPKVLDLAEERERFAKNWLGRDVGLLGSLLVGQL